jgi:serine/threonine protein kinase
MLLAPVEAVLGRAAGNYTLVAPIGSGGMGEVFRAVNPTIEAVVAIKVLHANATVGADAARFLVEARAVNRVRHDGVAKILDGGYLDTGRPYLVMELLDGESLSDLLERTRVDLANALRIIDDVLAVVATAHASEIVHRDLKPANVFLTRSGRTIVLDFGVAKLLDGTATLTRTGAMIGTPAYMAPEQIQAHPIDGRADIYAVGVMLYELLAGVRPFAGSTFEVVKDHIQRPPPPLPGDLPRALHEVVSRALAKSPDARYANATAMRQALAATGLVAPHVSGSFAPPPPRRGSLGWILLAAGLLVACATVVTIVLLREDDASTSQFLADEPVDARPIDAAAIAEAPVDAAIEEVARAPADAPPMDAAVIDAPPPDKVADKRPQAKATRTVAEVNKLVAEIKQLLASKSLIAIDIPKWYRQPYEDARLSADLELMYARAIELHAAVRKIVVDEKLVTSKLSYVKQVLDLRKPGVDAAKVELATAQLAQATALAASKKTADANRALTALYNDLAKWPKPGTARPAPEENVWK